MANTSQTRFASIAIQQSDKLRLLKFTEAELRNIKNVIQNSWHKPIHDIRTIPGSSYSATEFKLVGNPWCCSIYSDDSTASRVLVRDLVAHLFSLGWVLSLPTGISTNLQDCDTLIFRELPQLPPESAWLVIMFGKDDRLRVIGAPSDLIVGIRMVLGFAGIQNEKWENRTKNAYEFTLHGHPWRAGDGESVATRMLVVTLLETLEGFGWSLYTSLKHNFRDNSSENKKDNWYCVRRTDWGPGMPVFHR